MAWKLDDSRSIWPQLKEVIKKDIISGKYPPGGSFPTVRDLALEAGVNRNTMQRAMSELEEEGLIITNRTSGKTVTDNGELILKIRRELAMVSAINYLEEMRSLGYSIESAANLLKEISEK